MCSRSCTKSRKRSSMWQLQTFTILQNHTITENVIKPIHNIQSALYSICSVWYKTHYETLGLERNATQKEIKEAYIRIGKELHPDLHRKKEQLDQEHGKEIEKDSYTTQFTSLNEAYSVLSKPDSRRTYDLSLPGQTTKNGKYVRYRSYETFEERAGAVYGYKVDPDYWNQYDRKSSKKRIVFYCLLWTTFGAFLQIMFVNWATIRQAKYLDEQTVMNTKLLEKAQKNALNRKNLKDKENGEFDKLIALYNSENKSGDISKEKS